MENQILTRDNLLKRGFCGPNFLSLCNKAKESIHHLFVDCSFAHNVWKEITGKLKFFICWSHPSLEEDLLCWIHRLPSFKSLPLVFALGYMEST